jgi:hypothetical protein
MKNTYIATQLSPEDFRQLNITAATLGQSKSGILRHLVQQYLAKVRAKAAAAATK